MSVVTGIPNRHMYDSTESLLRFAMRADGTLTGLFGLAIAVIADLNSDLEYALGALFVVYGLVVYSLTGLADLRGVGVGVIVANIVLTLGALVAVEAVPMSAAGVAATLATGVYAAGFAWLQYLGVRRLQTA
ncbi:hypothetical protein [Mycobacterium montefiorense]|uniref:Uncharacterized protein n=1 Tax=Mycobacterium montefiorense TaxID=154654 RepID=A0AA37PRB8_9MYCO|nr:hypothetical protein [Mycobacterium montefiorense]MCV7425928.1 hypothetical protein [Mycobacterium montefiorense]GBG39399.1 hypothetical protein MmonteBS_37710 [Mycobacterium montefiorense]GKU33224.1 hypothetical protein NJB14191_05710 [Mycobacterium montefiorense]GKU42259.1 hypothetical protein NJB14192_42420 [Mycobacterium montefiorense]GKU44191.1 hypothetical protein NJB14194_08200 [Mycobacterium montefiorense]